MLKLTHLKKSIFSILILFVLTNSYAQKLTFSEPASTNEIIKYTETFYGNDDRLIRGKFYQNDKIILKGHPNFKIRNWVDGPIFIKGITYKDVRIKYNIEIDKIILLADFSNGNTMQLVLNNSLVDSLYIQNHLLINASNLPFSLTGFYEPIYNGNFSAYIKHKTRFQITATRKKNSLNTDQIIIGKYKKPASTLYLHIKDEFVEIPNKKALISRFESKKRDINRFMKINLIRFKKADNNQLINLLKYCDEISSEPSNEK